jgi:3-oxo-5-alpha-steroid 4-dehydrogenase
VLWCGMNLSGVELSIRFYFVMFCFMLFCCILLCCIENPVHFIEIIVCLSLFVSHSPFSFLIFFLLAFQQHHEWYKETFKDYPRKRFALIPFIL